MLYSHVTSRVYTYTYHVVMIDYYLFTLMHAARESFECISASCSFSPFFHYALLLGCMRSMVECTPINVT